MSNHPIKVVLSTNITREAVLINPNVSAAEPVIMTAADAKKKAANNVIATGATTQQIMQSIHGK